LQKLEKNLNNEQKVAILDLFETSTAAADMFLAVDKDNEGLRWAWLSNKLKQMGHPPLPLRDSVDVWASSVMDNIRSHIVVLLYHKTFLLQ